MLKRGLSNLSRLSGGTLVAVASGAFSIVILAAIRFYLGENDANLYIFLSAFTTFIGAVAAVGIPEFGQVLLSGRRSGALQVPVGVNLLAIMGVVLFLLPESNIDADNGWQVLTFVLLSAGIGFILTASELRFRCHLLSSNSVSNYIYQNAAQHLVIVASFFVFSPQRWIFVAGAILITGAAALLWSTITSLSINVKVTLMSVSKEQCSFYFQRLSLVFIDTVLLLSAHNTLEPAQYFAMGVVNRVLSPVFIVLNTFLGMRQASILSGAVNTQVGWYPLMLFSSGVGFAFFVCTLIGFDSMVSACLSIVMMRLWVMLLSYECQRWLPASPLMLVVASGTIWGVAAWLIAQQTFSLIVVTSIAILVNSGVIVALSYLKGSYAK